MVDIKYNIDVLFNRHVEVVVDDISMDNMDLTFNVTKDRTSKPNTGKVTIYNLSDWTRSELAETSNPGILIKAGYKPNKQMQLGVLNEKELLLRENLSTLGDIGDYHNFSTLFVGEVDYLFSNFAPPIWSTVVSCGDGVSAALFSRVNKSFIAGTRYKDIARQVAEATNLGGGNLETRALQLMDDRLGRTANGYTASGNAWREMQRIVKSASMECSIEKGQLQFLDLGEALTGEAIVLAPWTGLIGSPTITNHTLGTLRKAGTKKTKKKIKCTSLLNPRIRPGSQVVIKSLVFPADKRIIVDRCEYEGSTVGGNWYTHMEGTAI